MHLNISILLFILTISFVNSAPAPKGATAIGAAVDATKALIGKGFKIVLTAGLTKVGSAALKVLGGLGKAALLGAGALGVGFVGAKLVKKALGAKAAIFGGSSGGWNQVTSTETGYETSTGYLEGTESSSDLYKRR